MPNKVPAVAQRMAAFSAKVLEEEEAPVAVRSFIEARAGSSGSKEYLPKTGEVSATEEEDAEESDTGEGDVDASGEPRLQPLSGPMAVPKNQSDEFHVAERKAPKRGTRAVKPEEFGPVELRQATASGGRFLTRSKAENLQKAASRIHPLASSDASQTMKGKAKAPSFTVGQSGRDESGALRAQKDLMDFGEVEIGQQTLSGSRKVGKLHSSSEDEEKSA